MRLSIIIPVYNAELTIERCLNSVDIQYSSDIEVIVVNDGSRDKSRELCEKYDFITLINIPNKGVSNARNTGLNLAKGDYVMFLDSDDFLDEEYIEGMLNTDADICVSGYRSFGDENEEIHLLSNTYVGDKLSTFLNKNIHIQQFRTPWAKCFKRSIIEEFSIRFNSSLRYGEDTMFVQQYLEHSSSIQTIDNCGYNYYVVNDNRKYRLSIPEINNALNLIMPQFDKTAAVHGISSSNFRILMPYLLTRSTWGYAISHFSLTNYSLFKTILDDSYIKDCIYLLRNRREWNKRLYQFQRNRLYFILYVICSIYKKYIF